jgi:S1-C subfamily serine protease
VYNPKMDVAPFIQTSAPVLPGMGGGPVLREKTAAFVGVVTQQYIPKVGAPITFAVPLDEYLPIAHDLQTTGRADRGTIGTRINLVDAEQAQRLGLPPRPAVVILGTRLTGPAEKAGVLPGDIVLTVDGVQVGSASAYFRSIGTKRSGTPIELQVYRNGRSLTFRMTLERAE